MWQSQIWYISFYIMCNIEMAKVCIQTSLGSTLLE